MPKSTASRPRGRPIDEAAREERRAHILAAARRCFVARGFHAASTADISSEAAISVANLYQYFPSKDALILAMAEQDLAADLALIDDLKSRDDLFAGVDDAFTAVADAARHRESFGLRVEIFAEAVRNPAVRRALLKMENRVRRALAAVIAAGQARGEVRADIAPTAAATLVACLMDGVYSAAGVGLIQPAPLRAAAQDFLRRGLGTSRTKRSL